MIKVIDKLMGNLFEATIFIGTILFLVVVALAIIMTPTPTDQFKQTYVENCVDRFELTAKECWYLYKAATGDE